MKQHFVALVLAGSSISAMSEPLFPNSIASNHLDFILPNDPGACWSISEQEGGRTEMYDPRSDTFFVDNARHFEVTFPNQVIRINVHPDVGNHEQRAREAAASVSRLPVLMRIQLRYVNILNGDGTAWSVDAGRFFTLYDGLMARQLAEHDLDETVFHETAHVALDPILSQDPDWRSNQEADGAFITHYAAQNPNTEDIAESALFAWTLIYRPGRLPKDVETEVRSVIPNRLEYLGNMMEGFEPPSCYISRSLNQNENNTISPDGYAVRIVDGGIICSIRRLGSGALQEAEGQTFSVVSCAT